MRITTGGTLGECGYLKGYYIQTFSMLFFEDTDFSADRDENEIFIDLNGLDSEVDNTVTLDLKIKLSEKVFTSHSSCRYEVVSKTSEELKKSVLLFVGKEFYLLASKITGKEPPWGSHTGIRPQKTAGKYAEKYGKDKAVEKLTENYLMKREKAELALNVSRNASELLIKNGSVGNQSENQDFSLYISIPFCTSRCIYCSFVSYANRKLLNLMPEYTDKLIKELELISNYVYTNPKGNKAMNLKTIYIGGGTPTSLNCQQMEKILHFVDNNFDVKNAVEYTMEAGRADTITEEKLELMKKYNVSRISINPQTLNNDTLKRIGRNHTVEDFYESFKLARKKGFHCINTDIIVGLPNESTDVINATVQGIIDLSPENISVHTMCIKNSAELKTKDKNHEMKKNAVQDEERQKQIGCVLQNTFNRLEANDYSPYYMYKQKYAIGNFENVGFSKSGYESMYNIYMMDEIHTVIGAGAGATTKIVDLESGKIERNINYKYPFEYIKNDLVKVNSPF